MKLLAGHSGLNVDQLRALVEQGSTRARRSRSAEKIRPHNAGELAQPEWTGRDLRQSVYE